MLREIQALRKRGFTALLCLSLLLWSFVSLTDHHPRILETIQDHLEMVEAHGHSHGFAEDLLWVMHGHSHEAADHDHAQVFLLAKVWAHRSVDLSETWHGAISEIAPTARYQIERPPRA